MKRVSLQGDSGVSHENDALEPRDNSAKRERESLGQRREPTAWGSDLQRPTVQSSGESPGLWAEIRD